MSGAFTESHTPEATHTGVLDKATGGVGKSQYKRHMSTGNTAFCSFRDHLMSQLQGAKDIPILCWDKKQLYS